VTKEVCKTRIKWIQDEEYLKDNVVLCCWYVNRMKSNCSDSKFIANKHPFIEDKLVQGGSSL
jgi:hypothetical protein